MIERPGAGLQPGRRVAAVTLAVVMLVACAEESPTIVVSSPTSAAPTVTVTRIVRRPMAESLSASGLLLPREEATVGAEVGGYRVEKVLVEEGALVQAGQELARLAPGLLLAKIEQAQAGVAQAVAMAGQARAEADRVESLDARGVMSIEQVAARRYQAETAEAAVEVSRAQLNDLLTQQQRLIVRAPVAGTVLERMVRPGDVASLSQPMFRLARDGLIELDAEVPEDALGRLALEDTAIVTLPSGDALEGAVRLISPRIDPLTKLGRVRVSLPLHPQLRPGGYGRAMFQRTGAAVLAVKEKAVLWEASGPSLIVIDDNDRASPVPVQTGARDAGFVGLEQGPPVGTRIVLGTGVGLLEGDRVNPVAEALVLLTDARSTAQ